MSTAVVLVSGVTSRVGRLLVDEFVRADVSVRALTRRPEQAALPATVQIVKGDLTIPESLDALAYGAVETAPVDERDLAAVAARCSSFVVKMLLSAWGASLGVPAYVTSCIEEVMGTPPRTFAGWAADNVKAIAAG